MARENFTPALSENRTCTPFNSFLGRNLWRTPPYLLNLICYLLDRQLAAQAEAFEREGGFTERLYRKRRSRRDR